MSEENKLNRETVEEAAERLYPLLNVPDGSNVDWVKRLGQIDGFFNGAKWQQERMYSEEDLRNAYRHGIQANYGTEKHFNEWFEQFKIKK